MDRPIHIEAHALLRALQRSQKHNIDYYECLERVLHTIRRGKPASKHRSRRYRTYYHYFNDNLSVYVVCEEKKRGILAKTIIIEEGRQ